MNLALRIKGAIFRTICQDKNHARHPWLFYPFVRYIYTRWYFHEANPGILFEAYLPVPRGVNYLWWVRQQIILIKSDAQFQIIGTTPCDYFFGRKAFMFIVSESEKGRNEFADILKNDKVKSNRSKMKTVEGDNVPLA